MNKNQLIKEIREFLKTYAKKSADNPEEYNSPDAYLLEMAANELEINDSISRYPFSEWGSGGYGPYTSKEGQKIHDDLLKEISKFI